MLAFFKCSVFGGLVSAYDANTRGKSFLKQDNVDCKDFSNVCTFYRGHCADPESKLYTRMHVHCKKTCNLCTAAPTGSDNTIEVDEDGSYTIVEADLGFAGADEEDTFKSVLITATASAGTLKMGGNDVNNGDVILKTDLDEKKLVFAPGFHEHGSSYATVKFKVTDSAEQESVAEYTLTFNVASASDDESYKSPLTKRIQAAREKLFLEGKTDYSKDIDIKPNRLGWEDDRIKYTLARAKYGLKGETDYSKDI